MEDPPAMGTCDVAIISIMFGEGPRPITPGAFKTILDGKKNLFVNRLNDFKAFETTGIKSVNGLISAVKALLPLEDFDLLGLDLAEHEKQIVLFAAELNDRAKSLTVDVDRRLKASQLQFEEHESAGRASKRVAALESVARILFGDDFKLIPEFGISADQGAECEQPIAQAFD